MKFLLTMLTAVVAAITALPGSADAQVAASFANYNAAPTFDDIHSSSIYVPMADGVRIAMRIDRPARNGNPVDGRFPVIWHHSLSISQLAADGTGDRVSDFRRMPELVKHGYVVVQVARRGNGQSLGVRRGYHDRIEAQDAFEVNEWLARQPWSTGKVGVYGCSNTGDAAMHVLTMRPPSLAAVFAGCFSWNKYDAFRRGGILAQWGTGPTRRIEEDLALAPVDGDGDKRLLGIAAQEHQRSTPLLEMWQQLPFRDSWAPLVLSRFWAEGSASTYQDQIRLANVPLYIHGGWHDELRDQGFITQMNLPGSRIVVGPWKHCNNDNFALLQEMLRFFDRHLKGIDNGIDRDAPIHYYTYNAAKGTEWRSATVWPLPETRPTSFFLSGKLLNKRQIPARPITFDARYDVSCPDAGSGSRIQPCHVPGSGASFAGAALSTNVEVTGHPVMSLWIASSRDDANLFAYLEDVAPDGTVTVVTEGRLRAALRREGKAPWKLPAGVPWHRAFAEDAEALTEGKAAELRFDMLPTSWVFRAGHRMQVTVTGSDHRERGRSISPPPSITIVTDRQHPSQVLLPIIPASR